jgi:hypothetical protein
MKLLSFEGYKMLNESSKAFEADLDKTLNENIGAALGSPVKFTKIKNNAKKYQQALVQVAINNLDFEKKKAAGNVDKTKADVLKAANNQKNQALKDQASAISDRMDQLATTPGLKKVASIAKNKSKMAAAETALKTADGEEAKALKLKIKSLNQKVAADQQELKDYEKADDKKTDDTPNQQNLDNVRTGDGEGGKGKTTPTDDGEGGKGKTTPTDDGEGGKGKNTPTDDGEGEPKEPTTRPESGKNSKDDMIARYQKLIDGTDDEEKKAKYQEKIDKLKNEAEERFLDPEFLSLMESELAAFEAEVISEDKSEYVNESVSAKFRRLMENKS